MGVGVTVGVFVFGSVGVGVAVGGWDSLVCVIAASAVPTMLVCIPPGSWSGSSDGLVKGETHPDAISAATKHKPRVPRILCFSLGLQLNPQEKPVALGYSTLIAT